MTVTINTLPFLTVLAVMIGDVIAAGPTAALTILDAAATPDGYVRQAVLPNGTFPGPLISGNKVSAPPSASHPYFCIFTEQVLLPG